MPIIVRSALFRRQLLEITTSYGERAGSGIASKFVDQIDEGVRFIAAKPLACGVYTRLEGKEFRKWRLKSFPISIYFRLENADTLVLEALYHHRMNIVVRLLNEVV